MTEPDFSSLPDFLVPALEQYRQRFLEAEGYFPEALVAELPRIWAGSDFVAEQMIRSPALAEWLARPGCLDSSLSRRDLGAELDEELRDVEDEAGLQRGLRRIRQRHMVRLIWRDLSGRADYHATVAELSLLAGELIQRALTCLHEWARARNGTPTGPGGEPVELVVLAMGKLGAGELNLSSDIDLIFAYEHEGETVDGRRTFTNHEYFVRLGQQLIRTLDQQTGEGFVFRVDMRLRPWGSSGALAAGFDALESYYEEQGREWERYALIKMRPVAGDLAAGERLLERLRPFVYRRYIDYGAFESLREMKALIEREVRRKGIQQDVKLGPGGIREVEFVVQAFQLIRGGQVPALREPNLLKVLPRLEEQGLLPEDVVGELREAYVFLRNVEHRLQAVADRQTQRLPDSDDGWRRLALSMGYADVESLTRELSRYRDRVRDHFSQVIAEPEEQRDSDGAGDRELLHLWQGYIGGDEAVRLLEQTGISEPASVLEKLEQFRESRPIANMQRIARDRLDRLMPRLLETLGYQQGGPLTCQRLLDFLDAVLRRSAYIALLVENPHALSQLVKLSGASPWIAEQLAAHPVLLDELLDVRSLYSPPDREQLDDELRQQLLRIAEDDLEQQMEVLRNFKQAHLLRVAASEVTEVLPLMRVSDYLTWLAESILEQVVNLAWKAQVARHGRPRRADGEYCAPDFVVVGYGKFGGIELGHNSDLDLVFLHDAATEGETNGPRPVSHDQFFARLAQRIIHILTTRTVSGQLYEVDTRLRPSGSAGMLVSSMTAFDRYQREQAWTWEHQALVRARVVAGCPRARARFDELRADLLAGDRDLVALREEVLSMRERMRRHLAPGQPDSFHIKQDPGGIVDIEFMVQYGVLGWASRYRELTRYTDNARLLETLAALELMPAADAGLLREAFLAYRSAAHRLALRKEKPVVASGEFDELREGVRAIWAQWFEQDNE